MVSGPQRVGLSTESVPVSLFMSHTTSRLRPLPPVRHFIRGLAKRLLLAGGVVAVALLIGTCGYHWLEHLSWLDALLNASMILTGMGPIDKPASVSGKLFASVYALFAGLIFLTVAAMLLTPIARRTLHSLHLDMEA
jgi:hypothetical protein